VLGPFENRGDPLPAADAHGHQRVATGALELIDRIDRIDAPVPLPLGLTFAESKPSSRATARRRLRSPKQT
jgi:hypothetical protein